MGLQYLLTSGGLMATNASFCAGYVRSDASVDRPDLKFNLALWGRSTSGQTRQQAMSGLKRLAVLPFSAFTPSMVLVRPKSRGSVRLLSPDPESHPEIQFNFLDNQSDRAAAVHALRLLRKLLQMPALAPFVGDEYAPGLDQQSDEQLLAVCRKRGRSNLHAVGTCRMGQDAAAVVDSRLRVHGIDGLRVADASIMPEIVSANTNAAVIMIGEKAADMILQDAR